MIRIIIEIEEGVKPNVIVNKTEEKKTTVKQLTDKSGVMNDKKCIVCGKSFTPKSGAQKRCSKSCGMKPKSKKVPSQKIDEVLSEVKESQSKPYEFGK